jgi:hypothetical protein
MELRIAEVRAHPKGFVDDKFEINFNTTVMNLINAML